MRGRAFVAGLYDKYHNFMYTSIFNFMVRIVDSCADPEEGQRVTKLKGLSAILVPIP